MDNKLSPYFSVETLKLEIQDTEKTVAYEHFPIVYCNNVSGLVQLLIKMNIIMPEKHLIKIAIDGGGGSLKFCKNIIVFCKKKIKQISNRRFAGTEGCGRTGCTPFI